MFSFEFFKSLYMSPSFWRIYYKNRFSQLEKFECWFPPQRLSPKKQCIKQIINNKLINKFKPNALSANK